MSNAKSSVGRSLIKKRFANKHRNTSGDEWVNQRTDFTASDDWNRLNLRSVTDQNSLDEFLTTAQLAGTDFAAGYFSSYSSSIIIIYKHNKFF